MALISLISFHANALIVSVNEYGDIPEEGMEITINEAEEDLLSGEMTVKLNGSLLCDEALTVHILRSAAGIEDEFCCAGACKSGNEETEETLHYTPDGKASWYAHFSPTDTYVTVVYTFSTTSESRVLTVHYNVTQGLDDIQGDQTSCKKFIQNGLLFIQHNDKIYHL